MTGKLYTYVLFCVFVSVALGDFSFSSFAPSDDNEISLISSAEIIGSNLTITPSKRAVVGAAWYIGNPVTPVGEYVLPGFKTEFTFEINQVEGVGGDGLAFVLQSGSPYVQGTIGAGIGYGDYQNKQQGIPDSLAIEFDTLQDPEMGDPNSNHCGVHNTGDQPNSSNEDAVILGLVNSTIPQIQVAGEHTAVITYDASATSFTVELDGALILSSNTFNLTDFILIPDGTCFVGITGSTTTTSWAAHAVTSWYFWSGNGTIDIPATIVYGEGLVSATYDETSEFYIQLVDIYGFNATSSGSSQGVFPTCNVTEAGDPTTAGAACVITDNDDGTYTASYTMQNLGAYDINVAVNGELVGDSPYSIFVSGPPSAPQCVATGPGLSATTAGEIADFTIQANDAIGTPITTGGANFLVWLSGPQTENGTVVDNQDGTYDVTYNVTISGDYTLTVMLDDTDIQDSPFSVVCSPNVVDASVSVAFGSGLTSATAGEAASFEIQGKDSWGNNATSAVTWDVSLDSGDFSDGPTQTTVSPGLYDITYTITDADDYSLTVADGSVQVVGSPFALSVVPGLPYADECELIDSLDPTISIDEQTSFDIRAEDEFGNHISVGGAVFTCTFTGPNDTVVTSTDNQNGTYTCTYTLTAPGDYSVDVDLTSGGANTGAIEDSPFTQSAIGPAFGPQCTATGTGLSTAVAGTLATFQVELFDAAGNPASSGNDDCIASMTGADNVTVSCSYSGSSNIYNAEYTATVAGDYTLNVAVNDLPIEDSPFDVTCKAGAVDAGSCTAVGEGLSTAHAGMPANFTITLRDAYGNPIDKTSTDLSSDFDVTLTNGNETVTGSVSFNPIQGTYFATYTLTSPSGDWNMAVLLNGTGIQGSPFTVSLVAGAISAQDCYEFPDPIPDTTAYEPDSFQIQTEDVYGNKITTDVGAVFRAVFTLPNNKASNAAVTTTAFSVYSGAGGIYDMPFTLNITGNYSVSVTLDESSGVNIPIQNDQLYIYVAPGNPVAANTVATGLGTVRAVAGREANFTITTYDMGGQPITTGGAEFSISMEQKDNGTLVTVPVGCDDNDDGTYSCSYIATKAGAYSLYINMTNFNSGPISGSPYLPIVSPGPNCPQNATVYGEDLHTAETNTTSYFFIQSSDCYGNALDVDDVYYDVLIEGPDCTFGDSNYVGGGLTNVTYVVMEPGNYSIIVQERGNEVNGSPFALTVTGESYDESSNGGSSSSSSSSTIYMIFMIIFIVLFVIVLLLLIAYILYDKKKKVKKFFKKHDYEALQSD